MNNVVNFIIESGVSLSVLAVIYVFFLRKETFFKLNRLFLIGSILFSVILPFLKFGIFTPKSVMLAEITVTPYRNLMESVTVYSHNLSGNVEQVIVSSSLLLFVYIAGVIFLSGRFLFRLLQIMMLIRKSGVQVMDGFKLIILDKETSPFSFLDFVFVSQSLLEKEGFDRMIAHEMEHVKQGHSFDVIILELLTVFQWFNPFMWMLRHAIRENHEYLADQAVLNSGVNRGFYKKLLLDQFVGGQLIITNGFNYSLIKNRIKMMSKIKSSKLALTKVLAGILVATALVVVFACEQKESVEMEQTTVEEPSMKVSFVDEKLKIEATSEELEKLKNMFSKDSGFEIVEDSLGNTLLVKNEFVAPKTLKEEAKVFFIVDDMPIFPGGDLALRKYIASAVDYPKEAQEKGIQGKVYVTFVVSKDGSTVNCKIARGVDPLLDKEALRVVESLPAWQPGKQKGEAVNVSYTVPINFVLK